MPLELRDCIIRYNNTAKRICRKSVKCEPKGDYTRNRTCKILQTSSGQGLDRLSKFCLVDLFSLNDPEYRYIIYDLNFFKLFIIQLLLVRVY